MAIRDASISHFVVMVPPEALVGKGGGKLPVIPRSSKAGWRWKTLAIPKAFPGFSAAVVAEHSWVQREGPAGSSEAISTWQNLHPHLGAEQHPQAQHPPSLQRAKAFLLPSTPEKY